MLYKFCTVGYFLVIPRSNLEVHTNNKAASYLLNANKIKLFGIKIMQTTGDDGKVLFPLLKQWFR